MRQRDVALPLSDERRYTGYQKNGGFAEYCVANARFCFPIPSHYSPLQAAPLLCAGLIGYRSLRKTGSPKTLGLYGFGSSAHIVIQLARHMGIRCFVFTRDGDARKQEFARSLGACWAGGSGSLPPEKLDACIIFASEGPLVVSALEAVKKGGIVVCAGIHMSDIPSFPYATLWNEKRVESVANLTVQDGREFFELVSEVGAGSCWDVESDHDEGERVSAGAGERGDRRPEVCSHPSLSRRHGRLTGSTVIVLDESLLFLVFWQQTEHRHKATTPGRTVLMTASSAGALSAAAGTEPAERTQKDTHQLHRYAQQQRHHAVADHHQQTVEQEIRLLRALRLVSPRQPYRLLQPHVNRLQHRHRVREGRPTPRAHLHHRALAPADALLHHPQTHRTTLLQRRRHRRARLHVVRRRKLCRLAVDLAHYVSARGPVRTLRRRLRPLRRRQRARLLQRLLRRRLQLLAGGVRAQEVLQTRPLLGGVLLAATTELLRLRKQLLRGGEDLLLRHVHHQLQKVDVLLTLLQLHDLHLQRGDLLLLALDELRLTPIA